jgi:hypothetical protein
MEQQASLSTEMSLLANARKMRQEEGEKLTAESKVFLDGRSYEEIIK